MNNYSENNCCRIYWKYSHSITWKKTFQFDNEISNTNYGYEFSIDFPILIKVKAQDGLNLSEMNFIFVTEAENFEISAEHSLQTKDYKHNLKNMKFVKIMSLNNTNCVNEIEFLLSCLDENLIFNCIVIHDYELDSFNVKIQGE